MSQPLKGKVAIVTGASAGIGWATAEELAGMGAGVVVQARRGEKLDELVAAIMSKGGRRWRLRGMLPRRGILSDWWRRRWVSVVIVVARGGWIL